MSLQLVFVRGRARSNAHTDLYVDIQNLISLQDVMDELKFGPNGGLIYALE